MRGRNGFRSVGPASLRHPTSSEDGPGTQLAGIPRLVVPTGPAPAITWLHGAHDSTAAPKHCLIDGLLCLGELAVGRKGARDVRREAVILSAHVKQAVGRGRHEAGGAPGDTPVPTLSSCRGLEGSLLSSTYQGAEAEPSHHVTRSGSSLGPPTLLSSHGARATEEPWAILGDR